MTAISIPSCFFNSCRNFAAERSGFTGNNTACCPPSTFDTSTPLFAQTNPCLVSVISTPRLRRTMRRLSRNANSETRASSPWRRAQDREAAEGRILSSATSPPSALETTLCFTTRMSPSCKRNLELRIAVNNRAPSDSPARISPLTATGRMRTSPAARLLASLALLAPTLDLGMSGQTPAAEVPASHQLLRSPRSAGIRQLAQIFRTIYIPRNPRQFEHYARAAGGLRRGQVRQEAVVPEAQRKQIARRSPGCIRAAPGRIRHQHRAALRVRSAIHDLLKFRTVDQRDIRRNHQSALRPPPPAKRRGHFDGAGLSGVVVGDDFEIETQRQVARKRIARHHGDSRPILPARQRLQHILAHRPSQRETLVRTQNR